MPRADCPVCDEEVFVVSWVELGAEVRCDDCDAKLEVVGLDPLELDPYVDEETDEGDDEEEDGMEDFG